MTPLDRAIATMRKARTAELPEPPTLHHQLADLADHLASTASTYTHAADERAALVRRLRAILRGGS